MLGPELRETPLTADTACRTTTQCRLLARSPFRAVAIWLTAMVLCTAALTAYDLTPNFNGALFSTIADVDVRADHTSAEPTIHFALHPHCPCTRVSLIELGRVIGASRHPVQIKFWVYLPSGKPESWAGGRSVQIVKAFPNSQLIFDIDGRKASDLGITTSGGIVVFDREGNLAFSGGVQTSRGMAEASLGSKALQEIIAGRELETTIRTPVYGCSLISPRATNDTEESYR